DIDTGNEKIEFIKSLDIESFIDFKKSSDMIEDIKRLINGDPYIVIIISISIKSYENTLKIYHIKDTIVTIGLPANTVISANMFDTIVRSLTIKGSYVYISMLYN